jgi:alkyl hydroperoxide reductase subunit AhpC
MSIQVGQKAPEFKGEAVMPDGEFKQIKLSDYKGKWVVLFFYPLDFTFVCPTEIKSFNEKFEDFSQMKAEIITCSTDSVYSHKAWQESELGKLKFPHLADTTHQISRAYGVLVESEGIALRGTFIIDPDGNLKHATVNDTAVGRNVEETIRTLAAFETGKLTGCGWTPGNKTIN